MKAEGECIGVTHCFTALVAWERCTYELTHRRPMALIG